MNTKLTGKKAVILLIAILIIHSLFTTSEPENNSHFDALSHYQQIKQNKTQNCGPFSDCYWGAGTSKWNSRYNERDNMGPVFAAVYDMTFATFILLLGSFLWRRVNTLT